MARTGNNPDGTSRQGHGKGQFPMTEMVYGSMPARAGEPILPHWWRTIDQWSLLRFWCCSSSGCCSALRPRCRWPSRTGCEPFHYVRGRRPSASWRSSRCWHRLDDVADDGAAAGRAGLRSAPSWRWRCCRCFGTDFGKGAVRWYSLGFVSVQPSEFLKPCFAIFSAWLMAASYEVERPARQARSPSPSRSIAGGVPGAAAGFRPGRRWSSSPGG